MRKVLAGLAATFLWAGMAAAVPPAGPERRT